MWMPLKNTKLGSCHIDMAGRQHQVNEFHCLTGCRSEYWGFSNDACGYLTQRKTGVSAQKAEWDRHIPFTLTAYPRYPYYNPPSPLQKSHWICTICRSGSSHSGDREQLHHLLHTGDASRYNTGLWRTRGQAHDDGIYRASTESRGKNSLCQHVADRTCTDTLRDQNGVEYWERKCADTIGTVPGWPLSMLKYKCIFQIKYTEAILSNSARKLLWFEITKMLIAVLKSKFIMLFFYIIFGTLFPCDAKIAHRRRTLHYCSFAQQ